MALVRHLVNFLFEKLREKKSTERRKSIKLRAPPNSPIGIIVPVSKYQHTSMIVWTKNKCKGYYGAPVDNYITILVC